MQTSLDNSHTKALSQPPFYFELDGQGVGIVHFEAKQQRNPFDVTFIEALRNLIGSLIYQKAKSLIFVFNKSDTLNKSFDYASLDAYSSTEVLKFCQSAQSVMREISALRIPTIATIQGGCFGLDLEIAMACDLRLASNDSQALFAMPQIHSGLIPFAGGIQRLIELVGSHYAMSLLLSGNKITAQQAHKINLIDELTPSHVLFRTAYQYGLKGQKALHKVGSLYSKLSKAKTKMCERFLFTRNLILDRASTEYWHAALVHSPVAESIRHILTLTDAKQRLEAERNTFVALFFSDYSQRLRHLQRTYRQMKYQYQSHFQVPDIKKLVLLGGGFMGAGIAYITATRANIPVRIKDIHPQGIQHALKQSYSLLRKAQEEGQISFGELQQKMQLITGGERFIGMPSADFVIEAVYEDLPLKKQIVHNCQAYYSNKAVFATNTSTLPIRDIAEGTLYPENIIGFHYISPIAQRQILEIIPHQETSEKTIATAIHFALQQQKIPLLVTDTPGFFINRLLTPYLLEAFYCLLDGESIEFIDQSLEEFGFQLGPLAMLDDMGLDIFIKSLPSLERAFGLRFAFPPKLANLMRNERKGSKNNRGFYLYHSHTKERTGEDKSIYQVLETITSNNLEAEQIVRRCLLMMINEAAFCWQEKVIRSQDEGNVGSVLGAFFPEFRGGIYAYIQQVGIACIVGELQWHQQLYGERFKPCDWLLAQASLATTTETETPHIATSCDCTQTYKEES